MKSALADLLQPFRVVDERATAIAAGDVAAHRMIAAWPNLVLPTWRCPRSVLPPDDARRWLWIWTGYLGGPDEPGFLSELGRRARVSDRDVIERWPALIGARLVFPDGTISAAAERLVQSYIRRQQKRSENEVKKIILSVNGKELHVYVEGDFDRIELGREGLVPMQRDSMVEINDRISARTAEGDSDVTVNCSYLCSVRGVEDL
jgi:hypothetical protein